MIRRTQIKPGHRHQWMFISDNGLEVVRTCRTCPKTQTVKKISRRSKIKRTKAPKKVKTGTLKNKLDASFKAMIRERDRELPCISCQAKPMTQAGHFVPCSPLSTRWHPQNVNGQCDYCNCWLHGNLLEYQDNLDKKFGAGTALKLRTLGRTSWKPTHEALEKLLEAAKLGHEAYVEIWDFYGAKRI